MKRKGFSILFAMVLVASLTTVMAVPVAAANTWTVDDDGGECPGADFTHPQDAVNAANPGDTILVYPGTYGSRQYTSPTPPHWSAPNDQYAPALIVYKDGLTIEAVDSDPANTIIETTHDYWSNPVAIQASTGGTWNGSQYVGAGVYPNDGTSPNAVAIIASGVTIDGFTLRKPYMGVSWSGFWNTAGVMIGGLYAGDSQFLGSDGNTVQNCVFKDVWHAVYIWHSSDNMIVNNTVKALGDTTGHWAAISTYDGYSDAQIGLGNLSENNLIAYNTVADKGIALGAWAPSTWTSNAGSVVCCNTITQVGVTYSHGPVAIGCNTGGFWLSNTDKVIRVKGVTYSGDTVSPGLVNLSAQLEYDGSADGSGVEVIFSIDGADYSATTTAGGVASTTVSIAPGVYDVETKVAVCDCCVFTDVALLAVYDPAAGFVTGGGWIDSPPGAYMPSDSSIVTEANVDVDWFINDTRWDGYVAFVDGPGNPPLGSGSLEMGVTASQDKAQLFNYDHMGTLLADIESITYATYRDSSSTNPPAQYPAINIEVDYVGDGSSYTTLVWEPIYAYGQSNLAVDTWQTWDTMAPSQTNFGGGWWSTKNIPGVCAFNCFVDWETIVQNNPNAKIKYGFGVNVGSGWDGVFTGAVDALSLTVNADTTTYDFEQMAPPTGKATFGFVAKYKKGADVPDGQTEFVFKAADFNFHSSSYDWLVVTGSDYARFKGTGTINGAGEYKFMLWAGDGTGTDGADTFRIKIWEEDEESNETVIYDNGMDQAISGGSIVVHTK